jgi:copper chaperone CopZ
LKSTSSETPVRQKELTNAVEVLDGVIETKIEKGALHVSYDPLATTEKKIEQAIRSTGTTVKTAATDTEGAHPDLPTLKLADYCWKVR